MLDVGYQPSEHERENELKNLINDNHWPTTGHSLFLLISLIGICFSQSSAVFGNFLPPPSENVPSMCSGFSPSIFSQGWLFGRSLCWGRALREPMPPWWKLFVFSTVARWTIEVYLTISILVWSLMGYYMSICPYCLNLDGFSLSWFNHLSIYQQEKGTCFSNS